MSHRRDVLSEGVVSVGVLDHGNASSSCGSGHLVPLLLLLIAIVEAHIAVAVVRRDSTSELVVTLVIPIIILPSLILIVSDSSKHFDLTTEDHGEPFSANGFFDEGDTSAVPPFVEFTAERVGFLFQGAEFARGEEAVTTGGVDVCDGRVDDG